MPLSVEDVLYSDDDELTAPVNDDLASLEYHDVTPEELDKYLNTELLMPTGGEFVQAKVIKSKCDADDNPMGKQNTNPILVQYPDVSMERLLPILLLRICTHKWILTEGRIPSSGMLLTTDVTRKLPQTILT
jgi:hypothetical protein